LSLAELREVERANLSAFFHELLRDLGDMVRKVYREKGERREKNRLETRKREWVLSGTRRTWRSDTRGIDCPESLLQTEICLAICV